MSSHMFSVHMYLHGVKEVGPALTALERLERRRNINQTNTYLTQVDKQAKSGIFVLNCTANTLQVSLRVLWRAARFNTGGQAQARTTNKNRPLTNSAATLEMSSSWLARWARQCTQL